MQHPRMMPRPHYAPAGKSRDILKEREFGEAGKAYLRVEMKLWNWLDHAWNSPLGAAVIVTAIVLASIEVASFLVQNAY